MVAAGGGGIPVGRRGDVWDGVDAVIDKDYAAAELAHQLQAEALVLVTGVDAVLLDFGKPTQRRLTRVAVAEAERYLAAGQFPAGSMGPRCAPPPGSSVGGGRARGHHHAPAGRRRPWPAPTGGRPRRHPHRRPLTAASAQALRMSMAIKVFPDTYVDSVLQLGGMRAMREIDGVEWASAAMATPANVETLRGEGVDAGRRRRRRLQRLLPRRPGADDETAAEALAAGEAAVLSSGPGADGEAAAATAPRSLRDAIRAQPGTNVAVISVPGDYAALAAHQALSAGLHVLLFSDNVPLDEEIALKDYAREPRPAGDGAGRGHRHARRRRARLRQRGPPGRVGVVAAAGTGAQEAMALLDRWGVGVSQVIGLGGRDLSAEVGGRMARAGGRGPARRPGHRRHPARLQAAGAGRGRRVLATAGETPVVAALIGLAAGLPGAARGRARRHPGRACWRRCGVLGIAAPDPTATLGPSVAAGAPPAGARARAGPRAVLRRHPVLRVAGHPGPDARRGPLQHPAQQHWGLPAPAGRTSASTWARRSTPRAGRTR